MTLRIGSLFSGIGGLELGIERAGLGDVVWQVEKDEWCRGVLATHWPGAERFDDVCTVGATTLAPVDVICGGFPCQDVSGAGKGAGLSGARSGLWYEYRRIIGELQPAACVVENVNSGARRWLPHVRQDMHLLGYRTRAFALSAFDVGAPHLRRRVFVVATHPERIELRKQQGGGAAGRTGPERPSLQTMARKGLLPTPTVCGNYNRHGASATSGDGLATMMGGPLNPRFLAWLMGFPIDFVGKKPSETP